MNKKQNKIKNAIREVMEEFGLPLDLGNVFAKSKEIEMRDQLAKNGIVDTAIGSIKKSITQIVENKIKNLVPEPIIFLRNYADVFTSLIKFNTDNVLHYEAIIKMIRTAFYNGEAGVIIDNNRLIPVGIVKYSNLNDYDKYEYVDVISATFILQSINRIDYSKEEKNIRKIKLIYDENGYCTNFVNFKWGREALSVWVWLWPYVLQKHQLHRQLALTTHFMNKKIELKLKDPAMLTRDVELLLDPDIPIIVNVSDGDALIKNKVSWLNDGYEFTDNILNFMSKWDVLISHEFGLRNNLDLNTDKERSLVNEVEASQSYYDHIEYNVIREWKMFVEKLLYNGFNIIDNTKDLKDDDKNENMEGIDYDDSRTSISKSRNIN